jgi:hypothetical protein
MGTYMPLNLSFARSRLYNRMAEHENNPKKKAELLAESEKELHNSTRFEQGFHMVDGVEVKRPGFRGWI